MALVDDWADDTIVDYETTAVDPGPWVILGTAIFCTLSVLLFPCMVSFGRRYEKQRLVSIAKKTSLIAENGNGAQDEEKGVETAPSGQAFDDESNDGLPSSFVHYKPPLSFSVEQNGDDLSVSQQQVKDLFDRLVMPPYPDDNESVFGIELVSSDNPCPTILDTGAAKRNRRAGARRYHRGKHVRHEEQDRERRLSFANRNNIHPQAKSESEFCSSEENSSTNHSSLDRKVLAGTVVGSNFDSSHHNQIDPKGFPAGLFVESEVVSSTSSSTPEQVEVHPADAVDAFDLGVEPKEHSLLGKGVTDEDDLDLTCCGSHAWWKPVMIVNVFDTLLDVAVWDRDMMRILKLAVPFSISAMFSGVFETVRIALVAHFIGTDAVAAYTIVLLILGLTEEFFGGFALTAASLCSHAYGNDNYKLAGQYVQISSLLYTLCMIPNVAFWYFLTDDVVRLFGFNEPTCQMAQEYARFCVMTQWFEGLDESYGSLLAVIGHERFTMYMSVGNEVFSTSIILILCFTGNWPVTLAKVGIIEMGSEMLFYGFSVLASNLAGWMAKYTIGMFRTNALKNTVAVKTVFKTAIPLALGQLLQYGEWEVLTIFVAAIDPASVTTWGIVGSLWDTLEALTEGFGDAGEIRVAYQLGRGRPTRAKLSSYKCILVSVICATIITSILWIIGEDLAKLLTPDLTLQYLIVDVLPLIGIGNITLTAGTVSWALVGSQSRYRLATFVAFVGSWCVTLPLAAICTYAFDLNLQGITSAVVIGYSVTGTSLLYILVRSDWERLSRIVIELNAGESDESSSSSSGSSSSGSSSSDVSGPISV